MARTIYKYEIPFVDSPAVVHLPADAEFCHVADQYQNTGHIGDSLQAWFEVDANATLNERWQFYIVGTGHSVPDGFGYLGTAITAGGSLVWHLYGRRGGSL